MCAAGPHYRRSWFSWYFRSNLLSRILVGMALGVIVGVVLGVWSSGAPAPTPADRFFEYARFFGDLFIRLLKMLMVPIVFFSLSCGAANIAPSQLGKIGIRVIAYYILTSAAAVCIGLVLGDLLLPLWDVRASGGPAVVDPQPALSGALLRIVPVNLFEAFAEGDILPVIFFAVLFGIGVSVVKNSTNTRTARSGELLYDVCHGGADVMYKMLGGVMQYAPVGVFVLIAMVFAEQGPRAVGTLVLIVLTVYLGLFAHLVICYGGALAVCGLGLIAFLRKAGQVMKVAFVTRSSSATLPVSLRVAEEKMGAPRSIASFTLPLGATVNLDGTALYLGVCATFIALAAGSPLSVVQQALVVIAATLISAGAVGAPGVGAISLLMVMDAAGLPVVDGTNTAVAYAMVLGIDALLDMGRTSLNVTGDMVGTVVVSRMEKVLDMSYWE